MTTQTSMMQFPAALLPALAPERLQASFEALVAQQDTEGMASRLPLAWVALAEWVGLVVDLPTGRIVGGPCTEVR